MAKNGKRSKDDLAKERAELEERLAALQAEEAEFDGRRRKELRAEIEEMLSAEGYSVADVFGPVSSAKKTNSVNPKAPAKYRHPENPSITWSGRGRQPGWYKDALANGKSADDLLI
jgi:DNA-binding protein H-NS